MKHLSFIVLVLMVIGFMTPAVLAATGERNCDISGVPFAIDVNQLRPQFMGWAELTAGSMVSIPLSIANVKPGLNYVVECNGLPPGFICQSGSPPSITGTASATGTYYAKCWVHAVGSKVKTDFNQSVFIFKIYDANELPYIRAICGD